MGGGGGGQDKRQRISSATQRESEMLGWKFRHLAEQSVTQPDHDRSGAIFLGRFAQIAQFSPTSAHQLAPAHAAAVQRENNLRGKLAAAKLDCKDSKRRRRKKKTFSLLSNLYEEVRWSELKREK